MKLERNTELTMLEMTVLPKIQKARECLRAGNTEEMYRIIAHDMIGLFRPYKESEMEKYNDVPDNLKESANAERMLNDANLYQRAIDLLMDEKEDTWRPIDENTLNSVENTVNEIMRS